MAEVGALPAAGPVPADHYENFPVASIVLPKHLRQPVLAIYRFARTADDIADEGDAAPAARLAGLAALRRGLDAIAAGDRPETPMLSRLADAVARHRLPVEPLAALVDAFTQDVTTARYRTFADLLDYCRRSANPIGALMLHLFDAASAPNLVRSDAICTALQLTNFWQDVAVDWAKGRVYLPLEDLDRFGVQEQQIAEARVDERWRALMDFQVARTRRLLDDGRPLGRTLPGRVGLELRLTVAGGARVLDRISAVGGDVFRRRPALGWRDWLHIAFAALFASGR